MNITAIAFTGYPVTDLPRARGFYENVLGLKPGEVWEHEGRAWIEYDIAGATLAITNMSPQWKPSNDGPNVAFEVEDFDAAVARLKQHAVKFVIEPCETPACRLAVISDPDGNGLAIHQRKAR